MPLADALTDTEFRRHTIERVEESDIGYDLRFDKSMGLWCPKADGIVPKVGDTLTLWGKGFGFTVRGIAINGHIVRYETEAEESERRKRELAEREAQERTDAEANRTDTERRYAALPEVFRRRLDRFRAGHPDFWWKHQQYELFCCEQALVIAAAMKSPDDVAAFTKLEWKQQKLVVPSLSDDHSGNSFGMACRLAHWYLIKPENVVLEHGALTPLVGCLDYGCTHDGSEKNRREDQ